MNASKEKKIESTPVEEKKVVKKPVVVNQNEEKLKDLEERLKKVESRLGL
jgi:uncharacterized coiled-coil protein SlyX